MKRKISNILLFHFIILSFFIPCYAPTRGTAAPSTPKKIGPTTIPQKAFAPVEKPKISEQIEEISQPTPQEPAITTPAKTTSPKKPPIPAISQDTTSEEPDIFAETPSETAPRKPPEAPAAEEELGLPIELPVIGTITLIPFDENGQTGMKVYLPTKGKKLNLGPLTIDDGQLKLIDDKLQYSARATLFGESVSLAIKDVAQGIPTKKGKTYTRVRFGIDFIDKKPTIELIPGKKAELTTVDLVLEKTKPVELIAMANILNQQAEITFIIGKKATDATAEFKKVPLQDIISQVKGTPLENVQLTSFKVTVKNISSKKPGQIIIEGTADLSTTPGLEDSKEAKEATLKITATDKEQFFQATVAQLTIPKLGTIHDAKVIADFTQDKKEVKMQGTSTINFPGIGSFDTTLDATLNKNGIDFSSTINQTISFAGITIKNVQLKFSTEKKTLALAGQGDVKGYKANVEIIKDTKDMISASASLTDKELKPFSALHIPYVSDITLTNPGFKFVKKGQEFEAIMHGDVTLFNRLKLSGDLLLKKTSGGQTITVLEVAAPADWKLSDDISGLGSLFNSIELKELNFVFSSNDYIDTDRNMTFRQGFNFVSKTRLTGPLVPVSKFTKTSEESLITLQGYIAPDIMDSVFKASIPMGVVIKQDNVTLGKLELEIAGKPLPSFALLTSLIVKPSPADDPLTLTARIGFVLPKDVFLAGTMQGKWENPFGIKGLAIGSDDPDVPVKGVAAEIAFDLTIFPETGLPESIGLAGALTLGTRHVSMAVKLPIAGSKGDLVLYGELDKLMLDDLADAAKEVVGNPLKANKMPDIGIEKMKIYIVPKATTIGEFVFDRGLTVRGKIIIPGFSAYGNFTVSTDGIIAEAMCTTIKWGPLLVTRRPDQKIDKQFPEYDGPLMHLGLSLVEQQLLVSGIAKLANIFEAEAIFKMSSDGIEFKFETALGKYVYNNRPLLYVLAQGKSSGALDNPQFDVSFDFEQNFQQFLREQIAQGIQTAKIEVTKGIATAVENVEKLREVSGESVEKINTAKKEVDTAKRKIDDIDIAIKKAENAIQDKQNAVNSLQSQIDDMNRHISDAKDDCNSAAWYRKVDQCLAAGAKITGYGTALAALVVSKETANGVLEAAKKVAVYPLIASREIAKKALETSQGFLEEIGKPVATGALSAARQAGTAILSGAKEVTTGALSATDEATKLLLSAVDIKKIHYDGKLQDVASGNLGNVTATVKIFTETMDLNTNIKIQDPVDGIKNLANKIVDKLKDLANSINIVQRKKMHQEDMILLTLQHTMNIHFSSSLTAA